MIGCLAKFINSLYLKIVLSYQILSILPLSDIKCNNADGGDDGTYCLQLILSAFMNKFCVSVPSENVF